MGKIIVYGCMTAESEQQIGRLKLSTSTTIRNATLLYCFTKKDKPSLYSAMLSGKFFTTSRQTLSQLKRKAKLKETFEDSLDTRQIKANSLSIPSPINFENSPEKERNRVVLIWNIRKDGIVCSSEHLSAL